MMSLTIYLQISRWPALPALLWISGLQQVQAGGLPLNNQQLESSLPVISITATTDTASSLLGNAGSASQGSVTRQQLANRPLLRPAEVLETVPGLIVTQHSGDGKANQYFLRGFNLDHGTDLATFVDGVPINIPSHAHGQGYTDLNFIIPELIDFIQYRKGPYRAVDGDFASAGTVRIQQLWQLEQNFAEITLGTDHYQRALVAGSVDYAGGELLGALDVSSYDGPWQVAQDSQKQNLQLRYSRRTFNDGWSLALSHYQADWNSTDQVAKRSIDSNLIERYGSLNPTDGGNSQRTALTFNWAAQQDNTVRLLDLYALAYDLNLFSDFTYFLNDPVRGDQFEQSDKRYVLGGRYEQTFDQQLFDHVMHNTLGISTRNDFIRNDGLFLTQQRQRYQTISDDRVNQSSAAVYAENTLQWSPYVRTTLGLRGDIYHFDVDANLPDNSGNRTAHKFSPKLGLVFGPFQSTEYYVNYGYGFHSNDARGTTIHINPDVRDEGYLQPVNAVSPLVRTKGGELGLRTELVPDLHTTIALWQLDSDSELVFVGDAGNTEASRPSRRRGIEITNYYQPSPVWQLDVDAAFSKARFTDDDPAGKHIADSIATTASLGLAYTPDSPWSAGLRMRYFGPRALIENNSIRSQPSTLFNAEVGYRFNPRLSARLEVLNLLDQRVNDIEYYYESCLASERASSGCEATSASRDGILDRHVHPTEPREIRASVRMLF